MKIIKITTLLPSVDFYKLERKEINNNNNNLLK